MNKGITWRDAPAGGPWHFPGIPGVYAKDVVVPLESTGRTLSGMKRIIAQHPDVTLEIVDMEEPKKPAPDSKQPAPEAEPEKEG